MPVLERSELEASPLSDLHAIADQLGLEGFRRMRKALLIDAILGEGGGESPGEDAPGEDAPGGEDSGAGSGERAQPRAAAQEPDAERGDAAPAGPDDDDGGGEGEQREPRARRRRGARLRRLRPTAKEREEDEERAGDGPGRADSEPGEEPEEALMEDAAAARDDVSLDAAADVAPARDDSAPARRQPQGRVAEGVVEVLGNGSAFLRVEPPEPSDQDVYISAAQVRRCELVSGDRVSGPVRTPRRSERYPSLVRIEEINGMAAESVSGGVHYDELPVDYPRERIALGSSDPTLEAIEWLTPLGRGSRAVIVGGRQAGKTETLMRLLAALHGREDLTISLVLAGARPEEVEAWREGPLAPEAALTFAASADSQDQAIERALDAARRVASRGGDALVLIDGLDGVHPHSARKALAAARNLREAGSLTLIATATRPFGGESTVIALDPALTSTGRHPNIDLVASGTLRAELLVGEDGAQAIARARAAALEAAG